MAKTYTSNDMKSMAFNPNSSHHRATMNNHSNQLNSNNDAYFSSRVDQEDYFGLDGFFEDFERKTQDEELQFKIDDILRERIIYKDELAEFQLLQKNSSRYSDLDKKLKNYKIHLSDIELLVNFEKYNNDVEEMIQDPYFIRGMQYDLCKVLVSNSYFNQYCYKTMMSLFDEILMKRFNLLNKPSKIIVDTNITNLVKVIVEENKSVKTENVSKMFDIIVDITKVIVEYAYRFIYVCVEKDNLDLAKLFQSAFKLNKKYMNALEYKADAKKTAEYRSMFNLIPDDDGWIGFLLNLGAKASTNETTLLIRRLYK